MAWPRPLDHHPNVGFNQRENKLSLGVAYVSIGVDSTILKFISTAT